MFSTDSCEDTYSGTGLGCRRWTYLGNCRSNPSFMNRHCRRSCNKCLSCQDFVSDCQRKAYNGECATNRDYMKENCAFSCGVCTPVKPVTPKPTVDGIKSTLLQPLPTLSPGKALNKE